MKISKLQTNFTRGSTKTIDEAIGDAAITRVAELENQLEKEQAKRKRLEKQLVKVRFYLCDLHTDLMLQCLKAEKTDADWRKLLDEMYALIEEMRGV
jgi:hypothetical protein